MMSTDKLTKKIIEYECGDMTADEIIDLFSELVSSGLAWKLQGSYGRMAQALIDGGFLSQEGTVLKYASDT